MRYSHKKEGGLVLSFILLAVVFSVLFSGCQVSKSGMAIYQGSTVYAVISSAIEGSAENTYALIVGENENSSVFLNLAELNYYIGLETSLDSDPVSDINLYSGRIIVGSPETNTYVLSTLGSWDLGPGYALVEAYNDSTLVVAGTTSEDTLMALNWVKDKLNSNDNGITALSCPKITISNNGDTAECAGELACTDSCSPGTTSCDGDGFKNCVMGSSGCYELNASTSSCGSLNTCDDGACVAKCFVDTACTNYSSCINSLQSCTAIAEGCGNASLLATIPDTSCTQCDWQCGSFGSCVDNLQNRSCTSGPVGCSGLPLTTQPVEFQSCTVCSLDTSVGACVDGSKQLSYSVVPVGCVDPESVIIPQVTSESCTQCDWQCSGWSTCVNDSQVRSCVAGPLGCSGSPLVPLPVESQSCTLCSWNCTDWSDCQSGDSQSRICTQVPAGCINTSIDSIDLTQYCKYVAPVVVVEQSSGGDGRGSFIHYPSDSGKSNLNTSENLSSQTENIVNISVASPCYSLWICSEWSTCSDGKTIRECTDTMNCAAPTEVPVVSQDCSVAQVSGLSQSDAAAAQAQPAQQIAPSDAPSVVDKSSVLPTETESGKIKVPPVYSWVIVLIVVCLLVTYVLHTCLIHTGSYDKELNDVMMYENNELADGFTEDQIKDALLKAGWDKKMVEEAMANKRSSATKETSAKSQKAKVPQEVKTPVDSDKKKIDDYIQKEISDGFDKQAIEDSLEKAGWEKQQVEKELKRF